jgi:hypothetical protein
MTFQSIYGKFSTTDFWNNTRCQFIKGSHFEDLGLNFIDQGSKKSNSIDLFFQSTWGLGTTPGLFSDIINIDSLKDNLISEVVSTWNSQQQLTINQESIESIFFNKNDYDDFSRKIKNLTIENVTAGATLHLGTKINNIKLGIDVPFLTRVTHFWVRNNDFNELVGLVETIKDKIPANFHFTPSEEEQTRLLSFVNPKKNIGLGDLRFFIERSTEFQNKTKTEVSYGAELFISPNKPNLIIPETLMQNSSALSFSKMITDGIDFLFNNNEASAKTLKADVGSIIDNFFATLNETFFSTQLDHFRTGFGTYLKSSLFSKSESIELFSRIRGDYLFKTNRVMVFPTENYDTLVNSGFVADLSQLLIFQGDIGVAYHFKKATISIGYDFYLRTKELVEKINTTPMFDKSTKIIINKSEYYSAVYQHKIFASTTYNGAENYKDFSLGFSAHYNFKSSNFVPSSWGVSMNLGFGF